MPSSRYRSFAVAAVGGVPLRRYVFFSSALVFSALALAMVISVAALSYAERAGLFSQVAGFAVQGSHLEDESEFLAAVSAERPAPPPRAPLSLSAAKSSRYLAPGTVNNVNITFYDCVNQGFCGAMANGNQVYEGAAACSYDMLMGTRFVISGDPTGRIYECEDRGLLADTWVDIFWYHPDDGWWWQREVGRIGVIRIVYVPEA